MYSFMGLPLTGPWPPNGSYTVYGIDKDGREITSKGNHQEEWRLALTTEDPNIHCEVVLRVGHTMPVTDCTGPEPRDVIETFHVTKFYVACGNIIATLSNGMGAKTPEASLLELESAVRSLLKLGMLRIDPHSNHDPKDMT